MDRDQVYQDEDEDEVQIANDCALQAACSLALQQGWSKIDLVILSKTHTHGEGLAALRLSILDDPVLIIGVLVAASALVAVFARALFSGGSSSSRRYR